MHLSVLIINYNVKHFLEQCLYSVQKACLGIDAEIIVVDNNSDKIFLALAEHFNNRFLFMDEYIKEFRKDVRMQVTIIKESLSGNHTQDKVMNNLQVKLRREMDRFEKDIYVLKTDFTTKLVSYLGIN